MMYIVCDINTTVASALQLMGFIFRISNCAAAAAAAFLARQSVRNGNRIFHGQSEQGGENGKKKNRERVWKTVLKGVFAAAAGQRQSAMEFSLTGTGGRNSIWDDPSHALPTSHRFVPARCKCTHTSEKQNQRLVPKWSFAV